MKAIMIEGPHKLRIIDMEKPKIKNKDDVLLKIISGGICGSDIGIYNGTNSLATYPRIIGHEYAGIVEEIGSGVTNVKIGDVVAVDPVRSCGKCYACKNGRHNVCSTLEVTGVHRDGGFCEYVVTSEKYVYSIDLGKDNDYLVSLVEPYSIGMEVNNRANIKEEDTVLIMGSGPIGCCVMQVAKSRGAKVVMTDLVDNRLERAKDMGADVVLNVLKEDLSSKTEEITSDEGFPVIVDTVCSTRSFEQAVELASPAGRVIVLGTTNKVSEIPQVNITKKELDVKGSRLNNHCFPEVIKGFEMGSLTPKKLCTHVFDYKDVEHALELLQNSPDETCKVILKF
ncbi:zinc-binding alcohol dehydrogenase family protein [Clostridium amazonitimonense]|uniref:zinc-binding alcohol dehydrogenase family protein n=1 Tax=Clostridium amazonitimonense TaxID=1499689 RepID=UPI0005095A2A|nr:zinc-binding alcohol dehydrogenase family protein [Clostridium amazonitimonense]